MVVGAGIGGMQASVDLANAGFKVYLVERDTAIGGRMAQLDKTFPTNDCSMCIISPKLIEVGKHPNIEILTNTELLGVEGEPGHFEAELKMHPRFVDLEKCTGCGECSKVCPIEVPNEYNMGIDGTRAIRKRYPQAIPGGYAIEKKGTSPCRDACPSHVRAQGYVALIAEGRFDEALKVIRKDLPFPAVCGRVCPHPCEDACNRGEVDKPVAIQQLKRFVSDHEMKAGKAALPDVGPDSGKKVAIIGGGPSGLSAAWFLRLMGHKAVVFESSQKAGGMLRYGIPDYRLPQNVLDKEIQTFADLGVEIKCNSRVGENVQIDDLKNGYDALYIACGAQKDRALGVPGQDAEGVFSGIEFLREIAEGRKQNIGEKVAVIGGGNTAIDAVRTAVREGAKDVTLIYRRTINEMPADEIEIHDAKAEGVKFVFLAAPTKVVEEGGKVKGLEVIEMELGEPDQSGRRRPIPKEGSEYTIEVDSVIAAIGQISEVSFLEGTSLAAITKRGWVESDRLSLETTIEGVFAGGDGFRPGIAIEAIAHGKEAAISIDRFLNGQDIKADREWNPHLAPKPKMSVVQKAERLVVPELDVNERIKNYEEVALEITSEQAIAEAKRCLACGTCSECEVCVEACQANAIDHNMKEKDRTVAIGSIVLAPGFDQFEAQELGEYGYGRWTNVVTSLDFERMLSATGPTKGHMVRPSDHKEPKKIGWIQCIGSRDKRNDRNYCSSVCCMFATKEAVIATDHAGGELETTIFMMDLRATGKGFDDYCNRAQSKYGVRYVRSMISRVDQAPETNDIEISYVNEDGKLVKETFDMLVLSTGLKPSSSVKELSTRVGIELDRFGFAATNPFKPMATSKPGVFVCGVLQGPKDIPETVAQASGAAAFASEYIASARGTEISSPKIPDEIDTESQDQRIGVWVCNCGINIGSVVNVPEVAEYASHLGNVVHAEGVLFACSQDNQELMKQTIKEKGLNRLVVASCTPRTHEPLFQDTLQDCGVNRYLFSMANIREHCSWVHQKEPERATEKAKFMVDMAVRNARKLKPLHTAPQTLEHSAMVLGGGLAGMTAALQLANQGFKTCIVEKSEQLGGNLRRLRATHDGHDLRAYMAILIKEIDDHDKIEVLTNARLIKTDGFLGNFESTIEQVNGSKNRILLKHGVTIVATGARETKPTTFGYGESDNVVTQLDLDGIIADDENRIKQTKEVVMIQCVGSRNEERPYCSKVCCSQALKNALAIKEMSPETNVTILYRDMRSYGMKEALYEEARSKGVMFMRYDLNNPPQVMVGEEGVVVKHELPRIGSVKIKTDLLALAAAIETNENQDISEILKIPRTTDGFFLEVHTKLGPVDFATDGVYMCGLAHGPKPVEETIAQAAAASARALTVLSQEHLMVGGQVSVVDPDKCAACLCCVRACPYNVPVISDEEGAAYINPAECRGCGVCASECPGKAIQLQHFTNDQIGSMLDILREEA